MPPAIQFGRPLRRRYAVGDVIEVDWYIPQHFIADGVPEECPNCAFDSPTEEVFAIEIIDGRIASVDRAEGELAKRLLADGWFEVSTD